MSHQPGQQIVCANCGHPDHGRFCSHCGFELVAVAPSMVGLVAQDVLKLREGGGLFSTIRALLRSPVRSTVALAQDPSYRGHWTFFAAATTVSVLVQNLWQNAIPQKSVVNEIPPDAPEWVRYVTEFAARNQAELNAVLAYTIFLMAYFIGYLVLTRLAPIKRTPGSYLKLACLSSGFMQVLMSGLMGLGLLLYVAFNNMESSGPEVAVLGFGAAIVFVGFYLYSIVYSFRVMKNFWGMSFWRTIGATLLVGVLTMLAAAAVATVVVLTVYSVLGASMA